MKLFRTNNIEILETLTIC